jgi:hypothetical protein
MVEALKQKGSEVKRIFFPNEDIYEGIASLGDCSFQLRHISIKLYNEAVSGITNINLYRESVPVGIYHFPETEKGGIGFFEIKMNEPEKENLGSFYFNKSRVVYSPINVTVSQSLLDHDMSKFGVYYTSILPQRMILERISLASMFDVHIGNNYYYRPEQPILKKVSQREMIGYVTNQDTAVSVERVYFGIR